MKIIFSITCNSYFIDYDNLFNEKLKTIIMDIDIYINRQNDLKKINILFVLLTDEMCWNNKDKNQLQKGFENLDYLMNYHLAKCNMLDEVFRDYFLHE